jgi:hypothetical protein
MKKFENLKRGQTFNGNIQYVPRSGNLPNLLGCTARSKIKDAAGVRHSLTCTIAADGLSVLCYGSPSLTKNFAIGNAYWDLAIVYDGQEVVPTSTWQFNVEELISTE